MLTNKNGKYTLKTYQSTLYTWAPDTSVKSGGKNLEKKEIKNFCNATAGSQGEDWICEYVYNQAFVGGQIRRYAYVACDYVQ